eukprot:2291040-Rhodomonas_salina.1
MQCFEQMPHEGMILFRRYFVENGRIPRYCTMALIFEDIYETRHGKRPPRPEETFDPRRARMLGGVKIASKTPKTSKPRRPRIGWRGYDTSKEPSPVPGLEATWGGSSSDGGHLTVAQ